ncbi:nitrilase-related carbon-nitrogen hydrolase (plasmid) [Arthrobacter sp. UC242_113]|uniref:nitrilase-related carbon-nitrogen hydrolase n=1 Tax=Arthrobacter sp. UC242_113 TaxID=3374550 RepID=UPI0037578F37
MQNPEFAFQGEMDPEAGSLRIAVLQATSRPGDPEANLATVAGWAQEAARRGAGLLVTPELFVPGYDPPSVSARDGDDHRRRLAGIAVESGIGLVASTVEHRGESRHICASLFDEVGIELTRYRKSHLFGPVEGTWFQPGDELPETVEFHGLKVALGICFDAEFPEFVRSAALRGAELLCVPTAVPLRPNTRTGPTPFDVSVVPTVLIRARAIESQLFIAYADQAEPGFAGLSTLATPFGEAETATAASGELILGTVDGAVVARARSEVDYLEVVRGRTASSQASSSTGS